MPLRLFAAIAVLAWCAPAAIGAPSASVDGAQHASPGSVAASAWVQQSNAYAQVLLEVLAGFDPEQTSQLGLPGYDTRVVDLGPDVGGRWRAALTKARNALEQDLARTDDTDVRADLEIMIDAANRFIRTSELQDRYLLPWTDVGKTIFQGQLALLQDHVAPERRQHALARLECYVGMAPGCSTPVTQQAKALFEARASDPKLLGPYAGEVERSLANTRQYVDGIRQLFVKYGIERADPALDALEEQLRAHDAWIKSSVLPRARSDFRLPPQIYADNLKNVGIDIAPQELIRQAEQAFLEIQAQMEILAPYVAKAEGIDAHGYRDVVKALKQHQLDRDSILPYYESVATKVEAIIREQRLVTLPERKMMIRLASDAESAANPAPHMAPPPFINNQGERGQFVLPLGAASGSGGADALSDDFTCKACAWTMVAHEGRPGHELQFSAIVERGVSLARSLFAFNSVNVEGWALYAEWMMVPHEPPGGQMIALQLRLQRAARALLDPMLNLGLLTRERAHEILVHDVGLSAALTRQELDRYMFRAPGQATSYFYGYSRLLELRARTQIAMGDRFALQAFNDFVLSQGLLPPERLATAVSTGFIAGPRTH